MSYRDGGMCDLLTPKSRRGYVWITETGVCENYRGGVYNLCVSNRDGGMYELQRRRCVWIKATGVCT